MLVVVALGATALFRRGDAVSAENRHARVMVAAEALAPVAAQHDLVVCCGTDVPESQTERAIGGIFEQELRTLLPGDRAVATIAKTIERDPADAAATQPLEGHPIRRLLERNTVVIVGGEGPLTGADDVIDADAASELLARELKADVFAMLTDADAVYVEWGKPRQRAIRRASPAALEAWSFAAGSMGPKVGAACRFANATGKRAAIGALTDLGRILAGETGTTISVLETGIVFEGASPRAGYARAR
jgi:carbamate kinase